MGRKGIMFLGLGVAIAAVMVAIAFSPVRCFLGWSVCASPSAGVAIPLVGPEASAVGIDYTPLADFLAQQQWKRADRETLEKMLEAAGNPSVEYLEISELDRLPCQDLQTLDRLWVTYSNGKFGFSKQQEIGRSLERDEPPPQGKSENERQWQRDRRFGQRLGWDKLISEGMTFNLKAAPGHLPSATFAINSSPCCRCGIFGGFCWAGLLCPCGETANIDAVRSLLSHVEQCRV